MPLSNTEEQYGILCVVGCISSAEVGVQSLTKLWKTATTGDFPLSVAVMADIIK